MHGLISQGQEFMAVDRKAKLFFVKVNIAFNLKQKLLCGKGFRFLFTANCLSFFAHLVWHLLF